MIPPSTSVLPHGAFTAVLAIGVFANLLWVTDAWNAAAGALAASIIPAYLFGHSIPTLVYLASTAVSIMIIKSTPLGPYGGVEDGEV